MSFVKVKDARQRIRFVIALCCVVAVAMAFIPAAGAIPIYYSSRPSFLADSRVTTTTAIDFDSLSPGTDLNNQTILGVTFGAPGTSPLSVIAAATGVRFPMSSSTAPNVLSPGGSNPRLENDDLELLFATPVVAAGLDVVFDVPDGASFVRVTFFDMFNNVLGSDRSIPAPRGAPGFQFVGLVTDSAIIKRVVFDEFDPSPGDDNVAYDSVVFSPAATTAVPEPGTIYLLGTGLVGLLVATGRKREGHVS